MALEQALTKMPAYPVENGWPKCCKYHVKALDNMENGCALKDLIREWKISARVLRHWIYKSNAHDFGRAFNAAVERNQAFQQARARELAFEIAEFQNKLLAYRPDMLDKLKEYVEGEDRAIVPTMEGLAIKCDVTSGTLNKWSEFDADRIAEYIVKGADRSFIEFVFRLKQLSDHRVSKAFDCTALGEYRDAVFRVITAHAGYATEKKDVNAKFEGSLVLGRKRED